MNGAAASDLRARAGLSCWCWGNVSRCERATTQFVRPLRVLSSVLLATFLASGALAQTVALPAAQTSAGNGKKVLSIEDYARWRSIETPRISGDGVWVAYGLRYTNTLDTRPVLHIVRPDGGGDRQVENGVQPVFSDDSRWVGYYVELPYAEAKKLRDANKPVPRKAGLMELGTGSTRTWDDIVDITFARGSRHLLLRRRKAEPNAKHDGVDVVLHDLTNGTDQLLGSVKDVEFNRNGELLAWTVDAVTRDANGLYVMDLRNRTLRTLDDDTAEYAGLSWNEDGSALAVLKGQDVEGKREKSNVLIAVRNVYDRLSATPKQTAPATLTSSVAGFPAGFVISERRDLSWSADGRLVFFGIRDQGAAADTTLRRKGTDEVANVDVWNTNDLRIQSVQMSRAEADRNFTFRSAFDVTTGRFIALADSTLREVDLTVDGRWGIGRDERPYASDYGRSPADLYRVNPATGERTLMLREQMTSGNHVLGTSPDGRWFLYWRDQVFHVYDLDRGTSSPLLRGEGPDFVNTDFDNFGPRPPWGLAAWTKDGTGVVLAQKHDLWLVPLNGGTPRNLTLGTGAKDEIRLRWINTSSTEGMGPVERARTLTFDPARPQLFSAYGQWTKKSGWYELRDGAMKPLVFEDAAYGPLGKAARADRYLFTRETFAEFPDLHVAGAGFSNTKKMTDVNPQQAEYAWGRRIVFDYTNSRGVRLQGILALPDDYQPGERRPMLVNFYEKMSQNLHRYPMPSFLSSMGSIPMEAVSRGYITMHPDVHFNTRTSHSDMLECVEAATRKVIELGYADPARIGVHGHSYGGQGVAFIGTRSRMFAAIGMGAGVTDLTSDFNHNWGWSYQVSGSGSNGHDYYIFGQGRQGTNPWDDPELYRSESARTHVRDVTAPFLIMHGTEDGVVAFQEGLGFYNALRFNGKPATLLAYPGEGHGLRGLANRRDLTIRYFQFFDHYLRGAPAPRWLTEGVPYLEKDFRRDAAKEMTNGKK
jgi:dipeptidyl aminopeptidase/acylaminoacyl peptidase